MNIVISRNDFQRLSKNTRDELIKLFQDGISQEGVDDRYDNPSTYLSKIQVDKFVNGLSDKSKKILLAILKIKGIEESFIYEDFLEINGFGKLSGVLSGFTQRIRNITNNSDAELIYFRQDPVTSKFVGLFHPGTLNNLKDYFNINKAI